MLGSVLYLLLAVTSLLISAYAWDKLSADAQQPSATQRTAIYFGCVFGLALGAKLGYFFAEGLAIMRDATLSIGQRALQLMAGKTITGALLGAYAGVEYAKHRVGYRHATGDTFALIAPCTIAFTRLGCLAQGCCLGRPMPASMFTLTDQHGVARWPAVPCELGFNLAFLAFILIVLRVRRNSTPEWLQGQLFHLYLIAYGAFRFTHEFLRDTPRWQGAWNGYHILAALLLLLGTWGFARRATQARLAIAS